MQRRAFVQGLVATAMLGRAAGARAADRLPVVGVVVGASPVSEIAGLEPIYPGMLGFLQGLS